MRTVRRKQREVSIESVVHNRTVVGVGLASLFSDAGHEMATAALPGFLASLGAAAAALGAIEGIADGALSISKLAGGALADRPHVSRRRVAAAGYLVTGLGYGSFAFAGSWPAVAVGRTVAWSARGIRTPARQALLADAVTPEYLGRAFGLERAGDSTGAIVGPLLAAALLTVVGYGHLFAISFVPALLAAGAILFLTQETPRIRSAAHAAIGSVRELALAPGPFRSFLAGLGLFGLGNFSATLLILRAAQVLHSAGRSSVDAAAIAVLLYTGHNVANAAIAYPAGALADRLGRRRMLVSGMLLFALATFAFAAGAASIPVLAVLFAVVGASTGIVETAEDSHASELLPAHVRGRGFGVVGLVDGVGDLISSVVVGLLWTVVAPAWGFIYAGALAALGATVLVPGIRAMPARGEPNRPGDGEEA